MKVLSNASSFLYIILRGNQSREDDDTSNNWDPGNVQSYQAKGQKKGLKLKLVELNFVDADQQLGETYKSKFISTWNGQH